MVVATDLDGDAREAKVRAAIPITQAELTRVYGDDFENINLCAWSKRDRRVHARKQTVFGQLVLDDQTWKDCPPNASNAAMCDGVRDLGLSCLPWSKPARFFQSRVLWLSDQGHALPNVSDDHLTETLSDWLEPHLTSIRSPDGLKSLDLNMIVVFIELGL